MGGGYDRDFKKKKKKKRITISEVRKLALDLGCRCSWCCPEAVDVVLAVTNCRDVRVSYFRSSDACLAAARVEIDNVNKFR